MPGLVPGIHVFLMCCGKDVDGRDKPGHDDYRESAFSISGLSALFRFASVIGPTSL